MLAALDGLGKIFDSIRANVYKEAMTAPTITVFVCLGSNTPDAAHMLSLAVERLRALPRARVDALSGIYLTEPQDYADQPWFHNQVVRMELETNFASRLNLDELAGQVHVSRYYLPHIFKRATGYTLREYLTLCRISFACQQLTDSDKPIREIAELSGFHDMSNFSRSFRKMIGSSPSDFRKKTRVPPTDAVGAE